MITNDFHQHFGVLRGSHIDVIIEINIHPFIPMLANKFGPGFKLPPRVVMRGPSLQPMKADVNEIRRDGQVHRHPARTERHMRSAVFFQNVKHLIMRTTKDGETRPHAGNYREASPKNHQAAHRRV